MADLTDGLESMLAKMTGNRKCYDSAEVRVTLVDGDTAPSYVYCEREFAHPLPHRYLEHSWPSRKEIIASRE